MNCFNCKKRKGTFYVSYLKKHLCNHCLYRMNFRRFKNYIRDRLNEQNTLLVLDDGGASARLSIHFLKKTFPRKKVKSTNKCKKGAILPTTINEEAMLLVNHFLKKQKFKSEGIKPMSTMPLNEIEALCDYLKIEYKKKESKEILDKIEKHRPGVWFSVRNIAKAISDRL